MVTAFAGPSQADDADGIVCGRVVLTGGEKAVEFVDNGAPGVSIGDVRAGWRALHDDAGTYQGKTYFVATVVDVDPEGGGDTVQGTYTIALADGWLVAAAFYGWNDASDVSQRATGATLVITDGFGAYGGAEGILTIEPGDTPKYRFQVDCED
ncbi:hypothetical protein [Bauldia sp.]|uniref:hypothetical protein n=1 Tax=Bauldia sp. TaxID=2575872 RepID=UPI003BAC8F16